MAAKEPVEPWPLWGRVLAVTVFVVVLVAAGVAASGGGFHLSAAAVRILVAAVVVPGVVLLGVTRLLGRRLDRLDADLVSGVVVASVAVRDELGRPVGQRTTGAADDQLRQAANLLDASRRGLDARSRPDAVAAAEQLLAVTAAWSPDSDVTRSARSVGTTARRLRRTVRSLEQQRR